MIKLTLPEKGFTKAEREWLKELIEAIKTVEGVAGRNIKITNDNTGQVIGAEDCQPCS